MKAESAAFIKQAGIVLARAEIMLHAGIGKLGETVFVSTNTHTDETPQRCHRVSDHLKALDGP